MDSLAAKIGIAEQASIETADKNEGIRRQRWRSTIANESLVSKEKLIDAISSDISKVDRCLVAIAATAVQRCCSGLEIPIAICRLVKSRDSTVPNCCALLAEPAGTIVLPLAVGDQNLVVIVLVVVSNPLWYNVTIAIEASLKGGGSQRAVA